MKIDPKYSPVEANAKIRAAPPRDGRLAAPPFLLLAPHPPFPFLLHRPAAERRQDASISAPVGSGSFQKLRFGPFPPRSRGGRDGCVGWGSEELGGEHAAAPLARVPRGGRSEGERDDGEEGGQGRKEGRGGVGREGGGSAAVVPGGAAVLAFSSAGREGSDGLVRAFSGERGRSLNSARIRSSRGLNRAKRYFWPAGGALGIGL